MRTNNETLRSQHNEKKKVRPGKRRREKESGGEDRVLKRTKGRQQCTPPSLPV